MFDSRRSPLGANSVRYFRKMASSKSHPVCHFEFHRTTQMIDNVFLHRLRG